ncbi:MAG: hypothetical protein AAF933_16205 [Pseudomonadota bacterium]
MQTQARREAQESGERGSYAPPLRVHGTLDDVLRAATADTRSAKENERGNG